MVINGFVILADNNLGGCLADDMGLGKTLQAIALITRIHCTWKKKKENSYYYAKESYL